MYRVIIMICIVSEILSLSASAVESSQPPGNMQMNMRVHGNGKATSNLSMIDILKNRKLQSHPSITIGKAFDSYSHFSKIEWKEFRDPSGKFYYDCTGKLKKKLFGFLTDKDGIASRSLEVKFLITSDGDYGAVLATWITNYKDGRVERKVDSDLKGVIEKIYANRELPYNQ